MPTIVFTDEEVEDVREIIGLGTSSSEQTELEDKLSALNDAQAAATRRDVTAFGNIRYGTTKVKGGIKGTDYNVERDRLEIANKIRRRLNYPTIASATDPNDIALSTIRVPGWSTSGEEGY